MHKLILCSFMSVHLRNTTKAGATLPLPTAHSGGHNSDECANNRARCARAADCAAGSSSGGCEIEGHCDNGTTRDSQSV